MHCETIVGGVCVGFVVDGHWFVVVEGMNWRPFVGDYLRWWTLGAAAPVASVSSAAPAPAVAPPSPPLPRARLCIC